MTVVPPALPCRACDKCLKESHEFTCPLLAKADMRVDQIDVEVGASKRMALIRQAEDLMEQDPPLVPVAWENILDVWYNYVRGHNPKDYFGIYDVVRFDTFWLDKA